MVVNKLVLSSAVGFGFDSAGGGGNELRSWTIVERRYMPFIEYIRRNLHKTAKTSETDHQLRKEEHHERCTHVLTRDPRRLRKSTFIGQLEFSKDARKDLTLVTPVNTRLTLVKIITPTIPRLSCLAKEATSAASNSTSTLVRTSAALNILAKRSATKSAVLQAGDTVGFS